MVSRRIDVLDSLRRLVCRKKGFYRFMAGDRPRN